ncbi:hypothetical protein H4W33_007244 [Kibdelosporangium phytohabitans]|nr:hypothetical protein [Kibdelosporangium phytohabitans]MBE1468232.1 hypothetical protein [Kibdelosporangium phytohabitans]
MRALRHPRQDTTAPPTEARALIVAMPTTSSISGQLRNVPAEVATLRNYLPQSVIGNSPQQRKGEQTTTIRTPTPHAVENGMSSRIRCNNLCGSFKD